ncbi:unnamed protein product [Urochloa decumbens]|uniref:Uncharacterized protein n=1 Tax=Urochloa decumbens TaxID=240449 RepID=A0ABC8VF02_9POAL
MSRFLRPAALAAAGARVLFSALSWSTSSPLSLSASPFSSPSTPVEHPAAATGHLALVRAHPGFRELNAMLTPASFLVDATQALLAGALHCAPFCPGTLRLGREFLTAEILSAESKGNADAAAGQAAKKILHPSIVVMDLGAKGHGAETCYLGAVISGAEAVTARIRIALLDVCDGRIEDALDTMERLAAEHPGNTTARLYAAALCHVLGRHQDGARWLRGAGVPDLSRFEHKMPFVEAVLISTLGSAPRAVAGSEELVLRSTLGMVEMSMWSIFKHGDLSERLEVLAVMAFLRGVVARKLRRGDGSAAPLEGSQDATPN